MTPYGAAAAAGHGSSVSRTRVAPMPMNRLHPATSANARWLDGTGLGMGIKCTTFTGIGRVITGSLSEDTT